MFSKANSSHLYTTGFDYKLCLWNLKDAKKSISTNISNLLLNELGQEAMSYNPPFCYAWDSFEANGEHLVLGLGNGMLLRFRKNGLKCEEIHGEVHNAQISSLKVDRCATADYLFTASNDKTFCINRMKVRNFSAEDMNIS